MVEPRVKKLLAENEELRRKLAEAEQALEAIRTGQVESLVVEGPNGPRIFSLEGTNHSYRVLVEAMNEGAATVSEDGIMLYCNSHLSRMLDAPLERVMGSSAREWIPERWRSTFDAVLQRASTGDSRGELGLQQLSTQEVPVYLAASVIHDDGRRLWCLVATDLREQQRNEEMVAAERLARSVLEQVADAVLVCDDRGQIIRCNKAAETLYGRSPLFRSFSDAFPIALASQTAGTSDIALTALRGQSLTGVPASLSLADAPVDLLVSAGALRNTAGSVIGCVITLVDVTELRRAERALRQADHNKDEFLALLSHELRNPLAPIRNSIYILERSSPDGEQAHRARAVLERQVGQLTRLVDDLLDITRIERNKVQLQRQQVELGGLVRRATEDFHFLFDRAELELEFEGAPRPLMVDADPARIAQVLGNLLHNSIKFTGKGGRVRVEVADDPEAGGAIIRVKDTGSGMSPEMLARVFQPFAQADTSLDRSRGGLGLGLALVKGLVELHGGEVSAHSAGIARGTEIVVHLPLAREVGVAVQTAEVHDRPRRRILIIEDNTDAADSLREALELDGHEVTVAYNGPSGIDKARELRPEVVLCDIGLPGMDGYEVAQALRADPALAASFLVALTGYALPDDLRRAADAGFVRHLAKPPSLETLERLLDTLHEGARLDQTLQ